MYYEGAAEVVLLEMVHWVSFSMLKKTNPVEVSCESHEDFSDNNVQLCTSCLQVMEFQNAIAEISLQASQEASVEMMMNKVCMKIWCVTNAKE